MQDANAKELAILLASIVRNSYLEDLHAGHFPKSNCADYSDVKVVSPHGEVPWREVSRLDDIEMKKLMKQIVNRIYTALRYMDDPHVMKHLEVYRALASYFDEPEVAEELRSVPV